MGVTSIDDTDFGLITLPAGKLDTAGSEDVVVRLVTGARVAVIDAFRGTFPSADENSSKAREHLDMLQRASERTGCAIIVIAHSRKPVDGQEVRQALRGSGALFDAAQTVYMLDGCAGKPTKVHNTKDRLLGLTREAFGLTVSDEPLNGDNRWGLRVDYVSCPDLQAAYMGPVEADIPTMARVQSLSERMCELVISAGETGMTHAMLLAHLKGLADRTVFAAALSELIQIGAITANGRGTSAVYTRT
jgi:hypothetical protein